MTTRVEYRTPLYVTPRHPRFFPGEKFGNTTPMQQAQATKFGITGQVFYTYSQVDANDWTVANVRSSPFKQGYGYDKWRTFLQSRGCTVGTTDNNATQVYEYTDPTLGASVQFRGMAVAHFCSAFSRVFLGHAPPPEHIAMIKSLSNVNTKCLLYFLNFESVNISAQWQGRLQIMDDVARQHVLIPAAAGGCNGNGLNSYGCFCIDKYEQDNADDYTTGARGCAGVFKAEHVGCPHDPVHNGLPSYPTLNRYHTFDCDIRHNGYIQAMASGLRAGVDSGYELSPGPGFLSGGAVAGTLSYDGQLWDNVMERPYKGSALNSYPADYDAAAYSGQRSSTVNARRGWKGFMQQLQVAYGSQRDGFIWGNCGENVDVYDANDLKYRWVEYFFRVPGHSSLDSLVSIKSRLAGAMNGGLTLALGVQKDSSDLTWAVTANGPAGLNGTWSELRDYLVTNGWLDRVSVVAARASMVIFHNSSLVDLV